MEDQTENEIDRLQAATETAASHVRNLYAAFLLFSLYLAVTIGSTTYEQLLRTGPVDLPIIGVELPLLGFYWVAPALFLLLHFNLLIQLTLFAGKLHRLDQAIEDHVRPASARAARRDLLSNFALSQLLVGHHHQRIIRFFLQLMYLVTLILFPVILLLYTQIQFAAFQSSAATTAHRLFVLIDLILILILWPKIRHHQLQNGYQMTTWLKNSWKGLSGALVVAGLSLSGLFFGGWLSHLNGLIVTGKVLVSAWPTKEQIEDYGEEIAWQNFGEPIVLTIETLVMEISRELTSHVQISFAQTFAMPR